MRLDPLVELGHACQQLARRVHRLYGRYSSPVYNDLIMLSVEYKAVRSSPILSTTSLKNGSK